MFAADRDALLPGLETETGAELQEEGLEVVEQGFFEVGFEVVGPLRQPDESEYVGIGNAHRR